MKKRLFIGLMLIMMVCTVLSCGLEDKKDHNMGEETTNSPYDQDGDGYLDGWY